MISRDPPRPRGGVRRSGAGLDRCRIRVTVTVLALLAAACSAQDDGGGGVAGEAPTTTVASTVSEPVTATSTSAPKDPDTTTSTSGGETAPAASDPIPSVATTTSAPGADPGDDSDEGVDGSLEEDAVDPVDEAGATDSADGSPEVFERTVRWIECEFEGLECGVVTVPLDYRDPDAGELALTIAVHRATDPDRRIGYLVVNPGGPGASGIDMAAWALEGPGVVYTAPVLERFDIVGFDPRGVGRSEPSFVCGEPGAQRAFLSQVELPFDAAEEFAAAEAAALLCVGSMGAAAGLLHSEYVARDMDEIRKALGAEQVSYFGVSYGATLGVWYATLFPESVRAMVVDGADNPLDDVSTVEARVANVIDELRQFEVLLGEALDACDQPECPMYNDGDPRGYFKENVGALDAVAEATGGNPLAGALAIITPLYSEEAWPYLWIGYALLVEEDDPSLLAELARFQLGDSHGGTTFVEHVNCLDSWVLNPQLDRDVRLSDEKAMEEAVRRELPLLAHLEFTAPGTCPFYDLLDKGSFSGTLDGSDVPIIVIGNPRDPATPLSESVELVEETLSNGYLVEAEHLAHGVYPNNECANEIIHRALIDLALPEERTTIC